MSWWLDNIFENIRRSTQRLYYVLGQKHETDSENALHGLLKVDSAVVTVHPIGSLASPVLLVYALL